MLGNVIDSLHGEVVSLLDVVWRRAGCHAPKLGTFVFGEGRADGLVVDLENYALTTIMHVSSKVEESGVIGDGKLEAFSVWRCALGLLCRRERTWRDVVTALPVILILGGMTSRQPVTAVSSRHKLG